MTEQLVEKVRIAGKRVAQYLHHSSRTPSAIEAAGIEGIAHYMALLTPPSRLSKNNIDRVAASVIASRAYRSIHSLDGSEGNGFGLSREYAWRAYGTVLAETGLLQVRKKLSVSDAITFYRALGSR